LLSGEVFSDGGCEGSFTVIDMADGTDWVRDWSYRLCEVFVVRT
jgi:hypothetical protein